MITYDTNISYMLLHNLYTGFRKNSKISRLHGNPAHIFCQTSLLFPTRHFRQTTHLINDNDSNDTFLYRPSPHFTLPINYHFGFPFAICELVRCVHFLGFFVSIFPAVCWLYVNIWRLNAILRFLN